MFKNKNTGVILTDEEYRDLREREVITLWSELTQEEKEEWGSFEEFKEKGFFNLSWFGFEYRRGVKPLFLCFYILPLYYITVNNKITEL